MKNNKALKKCHLCGGENKIQNLKNRLFPWRTFGSIRLIVDFKGLACTKCNEVILRGDQCEFLDRALEISVLLMFTYRVRNLNTDHICDFISCREEARYILKTLGY